MYKRRPNGTVLYGTPAKGLPHDFTSYNQKMAQEGLRQLSHRQ